MATLFVQPDFSLGDFPRYCYNFENEPQTQSKIRHAAKKYYGEGVVLCGSTPLG